MSSTSKIIPHILSLLFKIHPNTVLDVGVGTGKFGFIIRDACDLSMHRLKKYFTIRIDGVEVEDSWINPSQEYMYDNLYIEDARQFEPKINYDLIIMTDFIEHLPKADGWLLVNRMLEYTKYMIISAPYGFKISPKEKFLKHVNGFKHLSGWYPHEFKEDVLGFDVMLPNFIIVLKGKYYKEEVKEK